jgi:hypothetical protein
MGGITLYGPKQPESHSKTNDYLVSVMEIKSNQ